TFYRLEAPAGAEISFSLEAGKTVKARVRDCSMGGLSFYLEGEMTIKVEQKLSHLLFQLPEANSPVSIHIAEAVVRRVEEKPWREKPFCALEIVEIADSMREKLGQLVFLNQRNLIRRVRRLPGGLRSL
ncbi:MAG: PilZ domain-containing protein, partial [Deltaproteobacteria bacterium]|nr:PilZ domain-containing protein [Deltaproteobacteria bacterium]